MTEAVDSPLYRVGVSLVLDASMVAVGYDGAFGETVKQNAISASLKVSFWPEAEPGGRT
ncbi:hypothetical protein X743_15965 [Mesorhizobium sp. LNHC252B00]|nr:hypothetical protein X743_15965 [Mesorhizobium sp. LNHC252B00]